MSFSILPISDNNPDIDMVNLITNKGFEFFEKYNFIIINPKSRDFKYYISYLRMFVTNYEVFVNLSITDLKQKKHIRKFIDFIIKYKHYNIFEYLKFYVDSKTSFVNTIEELHESFKIIADKMIDYLYELKTNKFNKIMNNFINDKHFLFILLNQPKIVHISIIERFILTSEKQHVYKILYTMARFKLTRHLLLILLVDIYDIQKPYNNIFELSTKQIDNINDRININFRILMVILKIFKNGITINKIDKFNLDGKEILSSATFLNKLFFIIIDYINISLIRLNTYINDLKNRIYYVNIEIQKLDNIPTENITYENRVNLLFMKEQRSQFKNKRYLLNSILDKFLGFSGPMYDFISLDLIRFVNNYYTKKKECLDINIDIPSFSIVEIIDEHIFIIAELIRCNFNNVNHTTDLITFYINVLECNSENPLTKNPDIKVKYLNILSDNIASNNIYFQSVVKRDLLGFFTKLCDLSVFFHVHSNYGHEQITIITVLSNTGFNEFLRVSPNHNISHRFIVILIELLKNVFDNLFNSLKNLYKINNNELLDENEFGDKEKLKKYIKIYKFNFTISINFINYLVNTRNTLFIEYGIKDKFTGLLNYFIYLLIGPSKKYIIKKQHDLNLKLIDDMFTIFEIFYKYVNNDEFKYSIVRDSLYYNTDYLSKLMSILLNKQKILTKEFNLMNSFIDSIVKYKYTYDKINEIDIPEDYADPIMGTLIYNPIMLPGCNTIMDKDVIFRHLLDKESNPFNRDKLTIDELVKFNERDECKKKCLELKSVIDKFIEGIN